MFGHRSRSKRKIAPVTNAPTNGPKTTAPHTRTHTTARPAHTCTVTLPPLRRRVSAWFACGLARPPSPTAQRPAVLFERSLPSPAALHLCYLPGTLTAISGALQLVAARYLSAELTLRRSCRRGYGECQCPHPVLSSTLQPGTAFPHTSAWTRCAKRKASTSTRLAAVGASRFQASISKDAGPPDTSIPVGTRASCRTVVRSRQVVVLFISPPHSTTHWPVTSHGHPFRKRVVARQPVHKRKGLHPPSTTHRRPPPHQFS